MKLKERKLELNKETISNLNDQEMKKVKGALATVVSCECEETMSCSVWFCCPPDNMLAELNFDL